MFQAIGIQAPVAMALWVGLISQFLPVVGTYIAGALPVLVQFVDSPPKALVILIFVILYQQVENYFLLPRITARTMDLHPAVAFGSAIAGAAVLGAVGAILAIPAAAMAQAVISNLGERHEVIDSHLTTHSARQASVAPVAAQARARAARVPTPEAFAPVAITRRSGCDESVHFGAVVGLSSTGQVEFAVGDPTTAIYPRSANKPMQAVAMVRAGLRLPPELLALVCASHDGTPKHLDAVRRILASAGLDERSLANTPDLPLDEGAAEVVLRQGGGRTALQMNCSGKHSGMLVTSVINGWPTDSGYLSSDHPSAATHHGDDRRPRRRASQPHRCRRLRFAGSRDLAPRPGSRLSLDCHGRCRQRR